MKTTITITIAGLLAGLLGSHRAAAEVYSNCTYRLLVCAPGNVEQPEANQYRITVLPDGSPLALQAVRTNLNP